MGKFKVDFSENELISIYDCVCVCVLPAGLAVAASAATAHTRRWPAAGKAQVAMTRSDRRGRAIEEARKTLLT